MENGKCHPQRGHFTSSRSLQTLAARITQLPMRQHKPLVSYGELHNIGLFGRAGLGVAPGTSSRRQDECR